jgi:hypothetical protein
MEKKQVQGTLSRLAGNFWVQKDGQVKEEQIEVMAFEGPTAMVRFSGGSTINMGNYESIRFEVGIEMPCYPEEVAEVFATVRATVEAKLKEEVEDARKAR